MSKRNGAAVAAPEPVHMAEYRWRTGNIRVAAEVAAAEIRRIQRWLGAITPEALVAAAREEDNPLHAAFEWDDSAAAERYRDVQARHMLRHLVVVYRKPDGEPLPPQRYLVKLRHEAGDTAETMDEDEVLATEPHVYVPVTTVMASEELAARYIRKALAEAVAWRLRHSAIAQFAEIFATIDRVSSELRP
jgi:hypothetical protein